MPARLIAIALAFGCCATTPASAKECSGELSSLDLVSCHAARYVAADKALNVVYANAMKSLSEDEKQKLKAAQIAWLKYRDTSFAFVIEANKDSRSYGQVVVADYRAKLVEKRVLELRHLLTGPADPVVDW